MVDQPDLTLNPFWCPDSPDFRDLTLESDEAELLAHYVGFCDDQRSLADLRDWMPQPLESFPGFGATAHACCTIVEYFRRQCLGITDRLSRSFLHELALIIERKTAPAGICIRAALKGIRLAGIPTDSLVRYLESTGRRSVDSPICFQSTKDFSDFKYYRVDLSQGDEGLETIKSLLRARIPCLFGMSTPSSLFTDSQIELRTRFDTVEGSTAGILCGFDDSHRIGSLGAFLFSGFVPKSWGDGGYGWISYSYFRQHMVTDVWVIMRPQWLGQLAADHGMEFFDTSPEKEPFSSNDSRPPKARLDPNHLR